MMNITKFFSWLTRSKREMMLVPLLLLLILSVALLPDSTAYAQDRGGIAISGTFYNQVFQIPQGAEISALSVYVTIFNEEDGESQFEMSSESPLGVAILFSEDEFTLLPGEQKKVFITVRVSEDAVPGQYEIVARATKVAAEVDGGQIAITAAVAQRADLTIVGESAVVDVQVVSPNGELVVSVVRLFKVIEGKEMEVASSETGVLEATVSPGSYMVAAYVAGQKLAEENFDVATDEIKRIVLTGRTVYIGGFGAVPNYSTETGKLAFVEVVYTINNFYQSMADVEVILQVSLDGQPLEETSLVTFEPLHLGRTGGSYNYIPANGWKSGEYSFKLELYTEGELYTETLEEKLKVESPSTILDYANNSSLFLLCIGILFVLVILFIIWRRKQQKSRPSQNGNP